MCIAKSDLTFTGVAKNSPLRKSYVLIEATPYSGIRLIFANF